MKNINKSTSKKLIRLTGIIAAAFIFLLCVPFLISWVLLDFHPYAGQIDSCMDAGGVWNDETNQCDGARKH